MAKELPVDIVNLRIVHECDADRCAINPLFEQDTANDLLKSWMFDYRLGMAVGDLNLELCHQRERSGREPNLRVILFLKAPTLDNNRLMHKRIRLSIARRA